MRVLVLLTRGRRNETIGNPPTVVQTTLRRLPALRIVAAKAAIIETTECAMKLLRDAACAIVMLSAVEAAAAGCPPRSSIAEYAYGGGLCLAATTFGNESAGPNPTLIVVVHGDISDGGAATYHVDFARTLARPGVVAVALIRPGYAGGDGRRSQGHNHGRTDSYTAETVAAIGGAVEALRRYYRARRVIYVGHSGGAAIGGVLIGKRPKLIDAAVLVSCPCDIARWLAARRRPQWTRSLSPAHHLHRVAPTTQVVAITGTADDNTTPQLARDYAARLAARGAPARFVAVEGAGHGFSGVRAATEAAVNEIVGQ
jgi:pimeloyl-ACP methyl ester carboxylesterase